MIFKTRRLKNYSNMKKGWSSPLNCTVLRHIIISDFRYSKLEFATCMHQLMLLMQCHQLINHASEASKCLWRLILKQCGQCRSYVEGAPFYRQRY